LEHPPFLPTTLSDTPALGAVLGPADVTWAYQWDVIIQPGSTFQISKLKNLQAIHAPEPATVLLLGLGELALGGLALGGLALALHRQRRRSE
jgi:hypothetical protein